MSVIEKSEILSLVAGSGLPRRRALAQLGLAKSTYYRWLKRQEEGRLQDRKGGSQTAYLSGDPSPSHLQMLHELLPTLHCP